MRELAKANVEFNQPSQAQIQADDSHGFEVCDWGGGVNVP